MSEFGVMGEVTVPVPIGALLAVFAEPTLNPAWNDRLAHQKLEQDASGLIVAHQVCSPHPSCTRANGPCPGHLEPRSCLSGVRDAVAAGRPRLCAQLPRVNR